LVAATCSICRQVRRGFIVFTVRWSAKMKSSACAISGGKQAQAKYNEQLLEAPKG